MELTDADIQELKKVPAWLKYKLEQKYVTTKLYKDASGIIHLVLGVGGRTVADITAKEKPEEEDIEGWRRMHDVLELYHFGNWMRRFCESMSELEDENTRKALEMSERPTRVPTDEEMDWMMSGRLHWYEYIPRVFDRMLCPRTRIGKVLYFVIPITIGYLLNKFVMKIGI